MPTPAIDRVPADVWSLILQHAAPTPPVLLGLRDAFVPQTGKKQGSAALVCLGVAACDDRLMMPFVGRRQERARQQQLKGAAPTVGYHLARFVERLDRKPPSMRENILKAYEGVLPWPKRRVKDADLLRAMFVHDKDAWKKVDRHFKPSVDLSWSGADFEVHGTMERSRPSLRADRVFALRCFGFDERARLRHLVPTLRDDEEIVVLSSRFEHQCLIGASSRLRKSTKAIEAAADAGVEHFLQLLLGGRTDLEEELSHLRKHLVVDLRALADIT